MTTFDQNLITKDEILLLTGIDLGTLQEDANPSNREERFINKAQSQLCAYIQRNYKNNALLWYRNRLTQEQRYHFKKAIAYQVEYLLLNGDIGNDSLAYDTSASVVKVNARKISPNAIDELGFCGRLCTSNFTKRGWVGEFMDIELFGGW